MRSKHILYLLTGMLLATLCGCGSAPVGNPVLSELSAKPNSDDLEFWHTLNTRPVTTHDDAFHGLLLYVDGADPNTTYEARVSALRQRGMLPANFNGAANEAVERGTLAVALVKILNLKGGVTMRLFGASPRYALRELEYRKIYPDSSEAQLFSGAEFLGILGRAEDFKEGDPANLPATVLYAGAPEIVPDSTRLAHDEPVPYPAFMSTMARNFTLLQPAAEPASQPAGETKLPDGPLKLVVTNVRGTCKYRAAETEEWKPVEKDLELKEGVELRTGLKSAVQVQIPEGQTLTLDRLGLMKITRAELASGRYVTNSDLQYGRARNAIDASGREYDSTVRSPNSTLGIRGTRVSLLDQRPFAPEAVSLTGAADFRNFRRQLVGLGSKGGARAKIVGDVTSAAHYALGESYVDPTTGVARTTSEIPLLDSLLAGGAVLDFDREIGIPVVRGGMVPQTDAELVPLLPKNLDFVLRWPTDANVNIFVLSAAVGETQQADVLFPAPGFVKGSSGAAIPFDHRGGANGGIEVVSWQTKTFPEGTYAIGGTNESDKSVRIRVDAYLNGKKYNNENSTTPDFYLQVNTSAAELVGDGYEAEVTPGSNIAILYDVFTDGPAAEAASSSKVSSKAAASKSSKKKPAETKPQPAKVQSAPVKPKPAPMGPFAPKASKKR